MLPILNYEKEILDTVASNQVTIIQADTGAGKSTQVPQMLWLEGYNRITVTQPRVMAAISLATRVAEEIGEDVGKTVGYKTRFYKTESPTPITYVTDGYLLSTFDSSCENEVVVLDEIHEFNLNQETLLGLYKKEIEINTSLKLVIMSATIDADTISNFFGGAPIIKIPGKSYPVEWVWEPACSTLSCISKNFSFGANMLVFLPGKEEIANLYNDVKEYFFANTENGHPHVFQLHGEMSYDEQKQVFAHYESGKIVFATNVAQTSITVPDIDIIVDTGTCKEMVFENGVSKLTTVDISQADCSQRAGRAGRCKPGKYILCSGTDFAHRKQFSIPEIKRISLENLVLKLAAMHLDPMEIEFLHSPDRENLKLAKKLLENLGALKNGSITQVGTEMEKMPVSARIARMLLEARKYSPEVQGDIAIIAAILECGDFRTKNFYIYERLSNECKKSDLTYMLFLVKKINKLWHSCTYEERKDFYKRNGIKYKIYQNILKVSKDIADKLSLQYMLFNETEDANYQSIRNCIISAYHDCIYSFCESWKGKKYSGADQTYRTLDRNSVFADAWAETPQFILAQPADINVSQGFYGPYTINLLKNATAVDMNDERISQSLLDIADCNYSYDETTGLLYKVFKIGFREIKREISNKIPVFEKHSSWLGNDYLRVLVDGTVIADIPA